MTEAHKAHGKISEKTVDRVKRELDREISAEGKYGQPLPVLREAISLIDRLWKSHQRKETTNG